MVYIRIFDSNLRLVDDQGVKIFGEGQKAATAAWTSLFQPSATSPFATTTTSSAPAQEVDYEPVQLSSEASASVPATGGESVTAVVEDSSAPLRPLQVTTEQAVSGETGGATRDSMMLDKANPSQARATVSYEVAAQMLAQAESERRGRDAEGVANSLRDDQQTLNDQRVSLDSEKQARRQSLDNGQHQLERGESALKSSADAMRRTEQAGQQSLQRIDTAESAASQADEAANTAAGDVTSAQQKAANAQQQLQAAQQQAQAPPPPPGQAVAAGAAGNGVQGKQVAAQAGQLQQQQAQQAVTTAQQQLQAAQEQEQAARQRQQKAEQTALQQRQVASRERRSLEELRAALDQRANARRTQQAQHQTNKENVARSADTMRDLVDQTRDVHSQLDEVESHLGAANDVRRRNLENARAADRNVRRLEALETSLEEQASETGDGRGPRDPREPGITPGTTASGSIPGGETVSASDQGGDPTTVSQAGQGSSRGNAGTVDQGDRLSVQLEGLDDGLSFRGGGDTAAAGVNRGRVDEEGDMAAADLADATAEQSGGGSSDVSESPGTNLGPGKGNGNGGPPGWAKNGNGVPPGLAKKL